MTIQNFWCNIIWCTDFCLHHTEILIIMTTETKIDNLNRRSFRLILEQKVFRFEITMTNMLLIVTILNSAQNRLDQDGSMLFRKVTLITLRLFDDAIKELTACTQLGYQVKVLLVLKHLFQANDIRMPHFLQQFHFTDQNIQSIHLTLSNTLNSVPNLGLTIHTLSHNTVMTVPNFLRVHMIFCPNVRKHIQHNGSILTSIFHDGIVICRLRLRRHTASNWLFLGCVAVR
mmetsp:Transcript_11163/g.16744  ORF Transcript_11163/g.16744 Transcript_11163/m.16744 type:complete len:230 (-) Transcript_11163:394-1083(-)